ncbi:MAG: N-acetylneuraminate synthase family protein [Thiohalomonadales bacterium]
MVKFIAEVSSNHNRDINRCFEFIDTAAEIGCYGIKFQLFKIEQLFAKEILDRSKQHRLRKKWELPVAFLPELAARCRQRNIKFGCTPFYLKAVDELLPHVDFYKIASYELLWHELIRKCAETGKRVIISTGMATTSEILAAVDVLHRCGCTDRVLLHCVSGYPTPLDQCNLAAIRTIRNETGLGVGWSDHSVSSAVVYRAVHRWHADIIEFHLDLDQQGEEYSSGHCWLPNQIADVIATVNAAHVVDGDGNKEARPVEINDREWRADPSDGLRPLIMTRHQYVHE